MKRLGVFCGSSQGEREAYTQAAEALANVLVTRELALVYGGGRVGLMGRIAEAVIEGGGEVIGVIPKFLVDRELAYEKVTELRAVDSMSERKAVMAELSDAFVALPGGYGTLDELMEMLTWTQLDIHQKPCGLLNTENYYDGLIAWIDHSVRENFVKQEHRKLLIIEQDSTALVDRLEAYVHHSIDKAKWTLENEAD